MSRVMPRPVSRCPRCQLAFGSADLMLDHLNAHHLTQPSSAGHCVAQEITNAHAVHAPVSDVVLADLERAFRLPSRPRRRRGLVIVALVGLLLVASVVVVLA